ncbi:MAG: hypothetical protein QW478_11395 [Candidatus Micrarchaeaceae archaeon]
MTKKWIQKSIKHKGSLTTWAKRHKFYKNNKIELGKAYKYAKKHHLTKRLRQINLAKTLRRFKK